MEFTKTWHQCVLLYNKLLLSFEVATIQKNSTSESISFRILSLIILTIVLEEEGHRVVRIVHIEDTLDC